MILPLITTALGLGLVGAGSLLASLFSSRKTPPASRSEIEFEILIPAHNEESKIATTLASLEKELNALGLKPIIRIALDFCTDQTENVARQWEDRLSLEITSVQYRSKWNTLQYLTYRSSEQAKWLLFLDSGISFDPGLLRSGLNAMMAPDLAFIAPAYRVDGGSSLSHLFWKFEKNLKKMENRASGPISVHGAAIAYPRSVLIKTYAYLNRKEPSDFKNDDVILPLAARALHSHLRGVYLTSAHVFDIEKNDRVSFRTSVNQRHRMMLGNLQWIRWMMNDPKARSSSLLWLLALRRVLRPFWVFVVIGIAAVLIDHLGAFGFIALAPVFLFRAAALASLQAPMAWIFKLDQKKSAWK